MEINTEHRDKQGVFFTAVVSRAETKMATTIHQKTKCVLLSAKLMLQ
jgi:hypothetical protein